MDIHSSDQETEGSSVPEAYLPPTLDDNADPDFDLSDALQSVSRSNSPVSGDRETPRRKSEYDYSISLRSEPQASPFDKLRNISFRRPLSRTRTPSLSRTTSSPASSTSNSTPHSTRSAGWQRADTDPPLAALAVPLPRSATASPAIPPYAEEHDLTQMSLGSGFLTESEDLQHSVHDTELLPDVAQSPHQASPASDRHQASDTSDRYSQHSREPTFSSEEAASADLNGSAGNGIRSMRSPTPLSAAFSSPGSAMFTPTPAFQPRPRARFGGPLTSTTPLPTTTPQVRFDTDETPKQYAYEPEDHEEEEEEEVHDAYPIAEDPATPHAHKRSFLLSVINSTARPRLRYPTPHPGTPGDESQSQSQSPESHSEVQATPAVTLRKAFAGVTPRPAVAKRARLSHPLTQAWKVTSESGSGSESPYDPAMDRASFVSTASSHDLTTHARANASFDPLMGLAERGHGVGRFNAGKLNSYLHGLNRRLQEENENLVARLRAFEEKYGRDVEGSPAATRAPSSSATPAWDPPATRRSSGGRRVSAGPALGLGDVTEEDVGEAWMEEKAALEEVIDEIKEELEACTADKTKAEEALEAERAERARDKDRWRERMIEVEKGVEGIVADLERRLGEAEESAKRVDAERSEDVKDAERRLAVVQVEKEVLAERLKKAEGALESGRELGAEVNAAHEQLAQVRGELQNAQRQMKELEDEVMRADERQDETEASLQAERKRTAALEEELRDKMEELSNAVYQTERLEEEIRKVRAQLRESEDAAAQYEADAAADGHRIQDLERQLVAAQENANQLTSELELEQQDNDRLVEESERASELARQMETALEAAEKKMLADEQEVATLKATVASLERAAERQQERSVSVSQLGPSQSTIARDLQAEVEALENELDDAHKEIARLQTVVAQSPARRAMENAKDARLELLEKEKEDLLERLKSLKNQSGIFGTPGRRASGSNMSPLHRQLLNLSFKSPKTPGGPLRDLSWLQNTMQDPSMSPVVAELARLQQELDRANASIDDKLDRLEDAGFGVVDLTQQLEDARDHINALEDEIARMTRKEERRDHRLQRLRCTKCRTKVDTRSLMSMGDADESSILEASTMSLPAEPPTPPTRTTEALRSELKQVNAQLDAMRQTWEEERSKILGENAVLQDAASRLNVEVRNAQDEIRKYAEAERRGEKARAGVEGELEKARLMMAELEAELKAERSRLRALTAEQTKAQREKEAVLLDLRRTESDMTDVREQLQQIKQENHELEKELRSNATAEQKARLLEARVSENLGNMEQLRQERSMLASDHKDLQRRYAKASEEVNRLKSEYAASQTSHDNRRHELDLRVLEIEDLRRALSNQASELERVEAEKARLAAEKGDVARTVAALEADLRRVRRDAEAFGRDLKALRAQKDKTEAERKEERAAAARSQKQAQAQLRVLKEELDTQKEKAREWRSHVCAADDTQLVALRQQHNKECKGLMVQIRYLKAKYTREYVFRCDLGYQKQYLLVLMARLERKEEKILAAIARIGYPTVPSKPAPAKSKHKSLKSVVQSVVFINRSRRAGEQWRQQRAAKPAIEAALQEVRKRRAVNGTTNPAGKSSS
ncbi:hypothetical protein TRAPUB_12084 [Trametes pubescens]|uniref:Pericentrin/AKAP-450 centrosomal targeting domain-containing protein n=1 Tax=Trametes pubescens TaxID=154538 RepID=A0A1M2VUU8_TRAPU|nr:hypothetical protein TRAPUB_12084 [Trametes pubescens]